jgi:hypothetical protein
MAPHVQHWWQVVVFVAALGVLAAFHVWIPRYRAQAVNNLKPGSRWIGYYSKFSGPQNWIPRGEFTERGLFYRRRYLVGIAAYSVWCLITLFLGLLFFTAFPGR